MNIDVECPGCSTRFQVDPNHKGTRIECPGCRRAVTLPKKAGSGDADLFAPGYQRAADPKTTSQKKQKPARRSSKKPASSSIPEPPKPTASKSKPAKPVAPNPVAPTPPPPPKATAVEPAKEQTESSKSAKSGEKPQEPGPASPSSLEVTSQVDQLLPPKFTVIDPDERVFRAGNRTNEHQVILPDGKGGFQKVDSRVVHVERDGAKLQLYSAPKKKKERNRLVQNIIAILIGIGVLTAAFIYLLS